MLACVTVLTPPLVRDDALPPAADADGEQSPPSGHGRHVSVSLLLTTPYWFASHCTLFHCSTSAGPRVPASTVRACRMCAPVDGTLTT